MNKLALVFATFLVFAPLSAFAQEQPDYQVSTTSTPQTQFDQNPGPAVTSADVMKLLVGGN